MDFTPSVCSVTYCRLALGIRQTGSQIADVRASSLSHKIDLSKSARHTSCFRSMVKSDLSGSSLTLLARLKKKWQSFGRSQHREHRGRQTIPETDAHLPSNEGDAEGPGSRKVWVFKGGGVLCKGVVMDDGRLLILEGLTEEPFLTSQKHVTGWVQVFSSLFIPFSIPPFFSLLFLHRWRDHPWMRQWTVMRVGRLEYLHQSA